VGQFFSPEGDAEGAPGDVADYIEGLASVPIPTYFTGDYGPSSGLGEATASPSTVCFLASLLLIDFICYRLVKFFDIEHCGVNRVLHYITLMQQKQESPLVVQNTKTYSCTRTYILKSDMELH